MAKQTPGKTDVPLTGQKKLTIYLDRAISKKAAKLEVEYLSYREIYEQCGILPKTLSRINTGKGNIRFETLEKLCNYLGCQPGDLLKLE